MCRSEGLEDGKEMHLPSWQEVFPSSEDDGAERCTGEQRQLHQASVALQLWFWPCCPLRFNEIYGKSLVDSTYGHNLTRVTATEETRYIWLLVSVLASHPVQFCVLHTILPSCFRHAQPCPFLFGKKQPELGFEEEALSQSGVSFTIRHQYLQLAPTLGRELEKMQTFESKFSCYPPYHWLLFSSSNLIWCYKPAAEEHSICSPGKACPALPCPALGAGCCVAGGAGHGIKPMEKPVPPVLF